MSELRVADEFSPDLGGRYRKHGPFSGEAFRNALLLDRVERALRAREVLHVNFDGVSGTPTSFLEEAFGGLLRARKDWTLDDLKSVIRIEAPHTPSLQTYMALAVQYMERQWARQQQN